MFGSFFRGLVLTAILIASSVGLAEAKPQVLVCTVNAGAAQNGIVTKTYLLVFEPGTAEGVVLDGLIKHETGDSIPMKVKDAANRTDFSWKFKAKDRVGVVVPLIFRATYMKADKSFIVTGSVGGGEYRGDGSARGNCKQE